MVRWEKFVFQCVIIGLHEMNVFMVINWWMQQKKMVLLGFIPPGISLNAMLFSFLSSVLVFGWIIVAKWPFPALFWASDSSMAAVSVYFDWRLSLTTCVDDLLMSHLISRLFSSAQVMKSQMPRDKTGTRAPVTPEPWRREGTDWEKDVGQKSHQHKPLTRKAESFMHLMKKCLVVIQCK